MTIEQLCECSADELDKLTFLQIEEYFKPFWPTTRPQRKLVQQSFEESKKEAALSSKQYRKAKATTAREVALEQKLTPERLAWLKKEGLL